MVRRLVVALMVVVVMAATVVVGPTVALGPGVGPSTESSASAQQLPGQPYCGPWHLAWYVSRGGYWYFFWWRWCWNPSLQNPWYIDWAGWGWGPYAGPGYPVGYWSTPQ